MNKKISLFVFIFLLSTHLIAMENTDSTQGNQPKIPLEELVPESKKQKILRTFESIFNDKSYFADEHQELRKLGQYFKHNSKDPLHYKNKEEMITIIKEFSYFQSFGEHQEEVTSMMLDLYLSKPEWATVNSDGSIDDSGNILKLKDYEF